jgi:formylglycine-generating enzyme required for sulfatase activity
MRSPLVAASASTLVFCVLAGLGGSSAETRHTPAVRIDLGGGETLEFVRIPGGYFVMGESHLNRNSIGFFAPHELIARRVFLSKSLYVGQFEVTVGQFRRFAEETGYQTDAESGKRPWRGLTTGAYIVSGDGWGKKVDASWRNPGFGQTDLHPVTCLSWFDAVAFCDWVSRRSGRKCRLPTEAELEYAQRGATETAYYWGVRPDPSGRLANIADAGGLEDRDLFFDKEPAMKRFIPTGRNDGFRYTTPVGYFQPNLFGLYDAIGNVWEYTLDWAGGEPAPRDPRGSTAGPLRSMRGGGWMSSPDFCRPSFRAEIEPEGRTSTRGLRVVIEE